ncbi:MAG: hypothetical protein G01um101433_2 [Parcubacteria group bacterium Gr01-1014_33]|nr:MAG: hypothetical protein G01um101433_2 [Parcubacteria group bacterium Gr01-1014_33]
MKASTKKQALRRLKILEGQVRGLQRMIGEESYCVDILHQSAAVKEALSGIENLILENHLSTCVVDHIRAGKSKKVVREILALYALSKKK